MSEDELRETLMTPIPERKVALFADGEQMSDWVSINPDGSSGYMELRESRTAQRWTFGISLTEDGPLQHVDVWPNGPEPVEGLTLDTHNWEIT